MLELLDSARHMACMKLNQWKSRDELEALQEQRLRSLISHAKEHVPYYREALSRKSVRGLEDLGSLPILTKRSVRSSGLSFISRLHSRDSLKRTATSGSTGMPMDLYHSPQELSYMLGMEYHQLTEDGLTPLHNQARIAINATVPRLIQRLGLFRMHHIPMRDDASTQLDKLSGLKASVLHSYPSFLIPLAMENLSSRKVRLRKVFSYAEMLDAEARRLVSRSFGARVYDMYGAKETHWIAWECEEGSMHLHSDSIIAEVVDGSGEPVRHGERGDLVLTPLWKRAMPLIRYKVGDRCAFGSRCRCGRGLHVLRPPQGRCNDQLLLPSGRPWQPYHNLIMADTPGILQYQSYQEEPGEVTIRIVADGGISQMGQERLLKEMAATFPEPMDIRIELVESIPREKSGKVRSVISKAGPGQRH
jgi:phenylacetate-CoA ligase